MQFSLRTEREILTVPHREEILNGAGSIHLYNEGGLTT